MARGGKRSGAGRKSNAEIGRARALINDAVSDGQWKKIFAGLAKAAASGDVRAADLLMRYAFGLPTQFVAGDDDAPPIMFVNVKRE